MAQDGFVDWLRDTFSADAGGFDDVFVDDQKMAVALPLQQTQQLLPDTAVLIQQMQTSLTQDDIPELADIMAGQELDAIQLTVSYSKAASAKAGSQRPKNTKRYKSLAQKEAHKRYRERKRASVSTVPSFCTPWVHATQGQTSSSDSSLAGPQLTWTAGKLQLLL